MHVFMQIFVFKLNDLLPLDLYCFSQIFGTNLAEASAVP